MCTTFYLAIYICVTIICLGFVHGWLHVSWAIYMCYCSLLKLDTRCSGSLYLLLLSGFLHVLLEFFSFSTCVLHYLGSLHVWLFFAYTLYMCHVSLLRLFARAITLFLCLLNVWLIFAYTHYMNDCYCLASLHLLLLFPLYFCGCFYLDSVYGGLFMA